ncbi:MAG: hypothetical protein JWL63_819 [Rhodocyclales bacterium]|nr:hypothetical protein [Rhodocyclales bacterium]
MAIQPVGQYVPPASAASSPTAVSRETRDAPAEQPVPPEAVAANPPTRDQLDRAMGEVRKALAPVARNLQFSIDDATGRSVVKVVDAVTNEVIRQMPSEELLAITRSMDKLSGLFVKQKA